MCCCVRTVLFIVQTGYADFPGKRRGQEEQDFTGKHTADSVQTWVRPATRLQETKTFGLHSLTGVVHKTKTLLPLTLRQSAGIIKLNESQLFQEFSSPLTTPCSHRGGKDHGRQPTTSMNRWAHKKWLPSVWKSLRVFSPDWILETDYKTRLRVWRGEGVMWGKHGCRLRNLLPRMWTKRRRDYGGFRAKG